MSYEVECGECGEQILIEDLGVEVACPHCETILILNAEDVGEESAENIAESEPEVVEDQEQAFDFNFTENANAEQEENGSDSGVASAILTREETEEHTEEASPSEETTSASDAPSFDFLNQGANETETAAEEAPDFNFSDPQSESEVETAPDASSAETSAEEDAETTKSEETPDLNFGAPATEPTDSPAFSIDTSSSSPSEETKSQEEGSETTTEENNSSDQSEVESDTEEKEEASESVTATPISETGGYSRRSRGPSPKVFQILVSYSILLTIAFLYLFFSFFQAKPHQLESLPDIAPPEEGEFRLIRENASLAPGHTLQIGETQRFGNIELTPLGVVRGPIEFEHFQGLLGSDVPPTQPVMKLKLKIKNVSTDQVFAPFDADLLALREHDPKNYDRVYANSWVCKSSDLGNRENRVLLYNHPPTSEFDLKGFVARPLNPGEEVETFLPTVEEGLGDLEGNLVWRFQVRKGFHPVTFNGVTTLVEVEFSSDNITKEST